VSPEPHHCLLISDAYIIGKFHTERTRDGSEGTVSNGIIPFLNNIYALMRFNDFLNIFQKKFRVW
jgi:hypothetical protein